MSGPRSAIVLLGGAARVAHEGVLSWAADVGVRADEDLAKVRNVVELAEQLVAEAAELLAAFDAA